MPIVPYSGGTSIEGHFTGWKGGGICVDMLEMDKIITIHAFVSNVQLDPGPTATIGDMLSTGCSGINAVRYGTAKGERFLNATVVRRVRSGIVTEVTIRLAPIVPITVATARFPDVRKASEAVIETLNTGIGIYPYSASRPECIEPVDAAFMHVTMVTGNPAREYDIADHLFFKLQGATPGALAGAVDVVKRIVKKHGGDKFWPAQSEEEAAAIPKMRTTPASCMQARAQRSGLQTYGIVPISKLPQLVYETQKDIERSIIMYFVLGHAGDGNFHTFLAFKTDEELKTVWRLVHRMVKCALALDGTCTSEHGVGIGKKEFLVEELGTGTVALMKTIKRAIDPLGIMNPGKLYPDDDATPDS
ncbi:FAD-linked oxidase-like protein [Lactarius deliciosus]|nr:FAD-linked oxidase-like protein [Lactarius deliciosus]